MASLGLGLASPGCQAQTKRCDAVAAHIAELAQAEGVAAPGLSLAIEADCDAEPRPSEALVECMLAAESLEAVRAC